MSITRVVIVFYVLCSDAVYLYVCIIHLWYRMSDGRVFPLARAPRINDNRIVMRLPALNMIVCFMIVK